MLGVGRRFYRKLLTEDDLRVELDGQRRAVRNPASLAQAPSRLLSTTTRFEWIVDFSSAASSDRAGFIHAAFSHSIGPETGNKKPEGDCCRAKHDEASSSTFGRFHRTEADCVRQSG